MFEEGNNEAEHDQMRRAAEASRKATSGNRDSHVHGAREAGVEVKARRVNA